LSSKDSKVQRIAKIGPKTKKYIWPIVPCNLPVGKFGEDSFSCVSVDRKQRPIKICIWWGRKLTFHLKLWLKR